MQEISDAEPSGEDVDMPDAAAPEDADMQERSDAEPPGEDADMPDAVVVVIVV